MGLFFRFSGSLNSYDGYASYQMYQGWHDGGLVWFIRTDTNNHNFAKQQCLTLAPKLTSALGAVPAVWIVLNPYASQGPVFERVPGQSEYAAVCEVRYVTWKRGFAKTPITSEFQIADLISAGAVAETLTDIVVDYPIVALGRLDGPWLPALPGTYRIPQGKVYPNYIYTKRISLPFYFCYTTEYVTGQAVLNTIIVPDVAAPGLAEFLGANLAPGLLEIPVSDSQRFWFLLPFEPPNQFPVIEERPTGPCQHNINFGYSPVMELVPLVKGTPVSTAVKTPAYVLQLISEGILFPIDVPLTYMNAPELTD